MTEFILAYLILSRLIGFRWSFMEKRFDRLIAIVRYHWTNREMIRLAGILAIALWLKSSTYVRTEKI